MPPVFITVATVVGAALAFHYLRKEWERVNRELEAVRVRVEKPATLRRDPETGYWTPR